MKNIIIIGLAAVSLAGCRSVTVKNYGQEVVDVNGKQTVVSKGWYVSHWQHWMITKADNISASIKPEEITFGLAGLDEKSDGDGLAKVVTASLSGAAELATKIGAAIATAGGTACADSISGLVARFVKAGGDTEKASVSCKDGSCTITDGATTCTGDSCYYSCREN